MPAEPASSASGAPRKSAVHGHQERLAEMLSLLVESGKAKTTADLVRYAEQAGAREAVTYLRELAAESLPLDLAFDALRVHLKIIAFKRGSGLVAGCEGKKVACVLPLPPHVATAFDHLDGLAYLMPDGQTVPPWLLGQEQRVIQGTRASRDQATQREVLVLEATREGQRYRVNAAVSDVVDPRILPPATRFLVHLRSQPHPADVPFDPGARRLDVL